MCSWGLLPQMHNDSPGCSPFVQSMHSSPADGSWWGFDGTKSKLLPASIDCASGPMQVHINNAGDWTGALHALFCACMQVGDCFREIV